MQYIVYSLLSQGLKRANNVRGSESKATVAIKVWNVGKLFVFNMAIIKAIHSTDMTYNCIWRATQ